MVNQVSCLGLADGHGSLWNNVIRDLVMKPIYEFLPTQGHTSLKFLDRHSHADDKRPRTLAWRAMVRRVVKVPRLPYPINKAWYVLTQPIHVFVRYIESAEGIGHQLELLPKAYPILIAIGKLQLMSKFMGHYLPESQLTIEC